MATRLITRFLLIALALYVFGLIFFLAENEAKDEVAKEEQNLPMDKIINEYQINETFKHRDNKNLLSIANIGKIAEEKVKNTRHIYETVRMKTESKNIKQTKSPRKQSNEKFLKSKNEKDQQYKNEMSNEEYWESLKNMSLEEKIQHVFKKRRIRHRYEVKNHLSVNHQKNVEINRNHSIVNANYIKNTLQAHSNTDVQNVTLTTKNAGFVKVFEDVFVFSSYYDHRQKIKYIRNIIIARSAKSINEDLWCHFWNPVLERWQISGLKFYETCENHLKIFAAYVGSCEVPENTDYEYIYISNQKESNINEMKAIPVIGGSEKPQNKNDLAVCVPPLFGEVNSLRLLEFIEFSILLGFKHFTFYSQNVTGEILRILNHYKNEGLVTILDWPLPVAEESIWYHGQSAAVWDCLYRNMYIHKLVAFTDIDEFIFPRNEETLTEFIQKETKRVYDNNPKGAEICAFRFQSAYFDPLKDTMVSNLLDVSSHLENYLVTLNSIYRKELFSEVRTKMIIDPIKIFEIGIHHVSKPMEEHFIVENIKPEIAYIHHYRKCESNYGVRCYGSVSDGHARRYHNRLITKLKWRFHYLLKEIFMNT